MCPPNESESSNRNQANATGKSPQAAGRQSKNSGSRPARGAATDKAAQRRGGQHSHGGR